MLATNFSGFDGCRLFFIFGWRIIFHDLSANFFTSIVVYSDIYLDSRDQWSQDLLLASVKIDSLDKDHVKTNRDPQAYVFHIFFTIFSFFQIFSHFFTFFTFLVGLHLGALGLLRRPRRSGRTCFNSINKVEIDFDQFWWRQASKMST